MIVPFPRLSSSSPGPSTTAYYGAESKCPRLIIDSFTITSVVLSAVDECHSGMGWDWVH